MLTYVCMCVGGVRVDRDDIIHVRGRTEKGYSREDRAVEPDREVRCARRCVKLSLALPGENLGACIRRHRPGIACKR